jgi:hypothetical protein
MATDLAPVFQGFDGFLNLALTLQNICVEGEENA